MFENKKYEQVNINLGCIDNRYYRKCTIENRMYL